MHILYTRITENSTILLTMHIYILMYEQLTLSLWVTDSPNSPTSALTTSTWLAMAARWRAFRPPCKTWACQWVASHSSSANLTAYKPAYSLPCIPVTPILGDQLPDNVSKPISCCNKDTCPAILWERKLVQNDQSDCVAQIDDAQASLSACMYVCKYNTCT